MNEEFQWEMARSVREAEDYHVLWIHDYRGVNGQGNPDAMAYEQTLNYLEALIERVGKYDDTSKLPQYFIFLDQNYFEANKSRLFFRVLLDPMDYELDLPDGYEEWEAELAEAADEETLDTVAASFDEDASEETEETIQVAQADTAQQAEPDSDGRPTEPPTPMPEISPIPAGQLADRALDVLADEVAGSWS